MWLRAGDEVPVVLIFIVIILTLSRDVERQAPIERPLRADIKTRHVLVENIVEVRIV